jgi:predicted Zn-dependent peptidase
MSEPFRRSVLENGVRILTERVSGVRSVSIGLVIDAGPQLDPPDRLGLAHFVEHAVFQGTEQRDSLAISRMIDEAGGQMGAFTGRDYTCYYANVLRDYSTYALELLGDILLNSTFPAENIEREKSTILRELELSNDDPASALHDELKATIWSQHPLGRPICGTADTVSRLNRAHLEEFVDEHYTGPRVIVAAAGDIDSDCFAAQTQDSFWRLSKRNTPRPSRNCQFQPTVIRRTRDLNQAYFVIALPTSPFVFEDRYALHLLNCILGGGMSSRLFRRLREEHGLVYHVQSENNAYRDAGVLLIEGSTSPDKFTDVVAMTLVECCRLFTGDAPVDEEELWKAKMQIGGQHQLAADSMHTRMSRLATQEFYFQRRISEEEVLEQIQSVTVNDLGRLATDSLLPAFESISVSAVGPEAMASQDEIEGLINDFRAMCV